MRRGTRPGLRGVLPRMAPEVGRLLGLHSRVDEIAIPTQQSESDRLRIRVKGGLPRRDETRAEVVREGLVGQAVHRCPVLAVLHHVAAQVLQHARDVVPSDLVTVEVAAIARHSSSGRPAPNAQVRAVSCCCASSTP